MRSRVTRAYVAMQVRDTACNDRRVVAFVFARLADSAATDDHIPLNAISLKGAIPGVNQGAAAGTDQASHTKFSNAREAASKHLSWRARAHSL